MVSHYEDSCWGVTSRMVPGLVVVLDISSCLTTPQPHVPTEYYMKSLRELEVERTEEPSMVIISVLEEINNGQV